MATAASNIPVKSHAMNGGDGVYSYSCNSFLQKRGLDVARMIMTEVILEKLDVKSLLSASRTFVIADLGCVAAVPGSFHGRLFPKASLHLVHSLYSIQWLSRVPKQDLDETSLAWNKGRIYIVDTPEDVAEAYRRQYTKDMKVFLDARAVELGPGGLMALLLPMVPINAKCMFYGTVQLLESVFVELITAGLASKAMLDSFNMPYYHPSSAKLEAVVVRDGQFVIEKTERVIRPKLERSLGTKGAIVMHLRAGWEGLIKAHFGYEIVEPLFQRFKKRLDESSLLSNSSFVPTTEMLFLLKHL